VLTEQEIKKQISLGEDSNRQFKEKLNNAVQIAAEMCAMSNSSGGTVFVGVRDDLSVAGLSQQEIGTYNQWIAIAASEHIKPAVYPQTQTVDIDGKRIIVIYISEGPSKPYCTQDGAYWIKSGSDKRKSSPQELLRMFQSSNLFHLDESLTSATVEKETNVAKFSTFFERNFGQEISATGLKIEKILENMNLAKDGKLTLAGLLLFGKTPQTFKPFCIIRAVSYYENEISDDKFIAKNDCTGTIDEQYQAAMTFLKNNLSRRQKEGSFNQSGELEISERALEETLVDALLHRDYSKNAVIRVLVFKNRIEVISPGSLPNHLTIENIKSGNSVMRNPLLTSFATKNTLPYSGLGSGVPRIFKSHPSTELINDANGEQFVTILKR